MRSRAFAVVLGVVCVAAVGRLAGPGTEPVTLPLGAPGSVTPHWIRGTPVWVVVGDDGEPVVLSAVNPHKWWGMDELVGWCEGVQAFQAYWDLSRFDRSGRYLFGPARRGLDRYDAVSDGRVIRVYGSRPAPGGSEGEAPTREAPWCVGDGSLAGEWTQAHPVEGSGRALLHGTVIARSGEPLRFCEVLAVRAPPRCPDDAAIIGEAIDLGEEVAWARLDGRFLAVRDGARLTSVIVVPHGGGTYGSDSTTFLHGTLLHADGGDGVVVLDALEWMPAGADAATVLARRRYFAPPYTRLLVLNDTVVFGSCLLAGHPRGRHLTADELFAAHLPEHGVPVRVELRGTGALAELVELCAPAQGS